jgi:hypothetical protein
MPQKSLHPSDASTELSVSVIRPQTELLAKRATADLAAKNRQSAKIMRKASRAPDHREEGGQG